jgi:hypothetical protein
MATATQNVRPISSRVSTLTHREAMDLLSREQRFMATVSAMNTLMIQKGVYTPEEMEAYFIQWAEAEVRKSKKNRRGWRSWLFSLFSVRPR